MIMVRRCLRNLTRQITTPVLDSAIYRFFLFFFKEEKSSSKNLKGEKSGKKRSKFEIEGFSKISRLG
jgi:hypothetical protein